MKPSKRITKPAIESGRPEQNRAGDLSCAGNELRLMEYLDGRLPAGERHGLEEHLAACPECRELCRQWRQLDASLAEGLARPALPPDFAARLWQQIESGSGAAAANSASERQRLEAELEARWAEYRHRVLRAGMPVLLDGLGYGVLAAVSGGGLFHLTTSLLRSSAVTATLNQLALPIGLATGGVVLLTALGLAGRKHLARWVAAL